MAMVQNSPSLEGEHLFYYFYLELICFLHIVPFVFGCFCPGLTILVLRREWTKWKLGNMFCVLPHLLALLIKFDSLLMENKLPASSQENNPWVSQRGAFLFSGSIEKVNYLFVLVLAIVGISPVLANCGNDITRKVYLGTDHFTVMSLQLPSWYYHPTLSGQGGKIIWELAAGEISSKCCLFSFPLSVRLSSFYCIIKLNCHFMKVIVSYEYKKIAHWIKLY